MIALLVIVYTAFVLVLFKILRLKPTPYLIAGLLVAGVVMIGGVVVAWMQSAPMSGKLATNQYVVQLVPYVKGQVKEVHARANEPLKEGDLLLQIDPAPYQYEVDQLEAQLNVSKVNVLQAQAAAKAADENVAKAKDQVAEAQAAVVQARDGVASAEAALAKAKAADVLAKTTEQIEVGLQRVDVGAIPKLGWIRRFNEGRRQMPSSGRPMPARGRHSLGSNILWLFWLPRDRRRIKLKRRLNELRMLSWWPGPACRPLKHS